MFARMALVCIVVFFCAVNANAMTPVALVGSLAATATNGPAPKPDQGDDSACKSEECDPGTPYTGNDPPAPSDAEGIDSDASKDEKQG